ncbi:Crp/Fnr family transcriptional regulator [Aurantiacibacter marinus]|uniref:Crp/Fnr family transcriptional regulator n=1 Tax=Aurantiacibacter marinus TaxID=874156 RepID=A0A0H0XJW9_9SPHN|nr:Crp/Fnr family transcriptional regulator [Aurantiacibacter marinus]KLI62873.1 Crp/Fnr family transcriptional regulator [Aurantiacibacter marinus]
MSSCDTCVVRNTAICSGLDAGEIALLSTIGRQRKLAPGESLVWEGEDSVLVANVISGLLKLSAGTEDGREQIVGVVYPADFIGRPFGRSTEYTVTALTDAEVCVFARSDFDRFAGEHPRLEHKLLERTLTELDRTRRWMLLLSRKNAQEKVATFLLEMSERLAPADCEGGANPQPLKGFDLPFSRQQIGDVLGLTIETVSRQMMALNRSGVIALPNRRAVEIIDRPALLAMAR